MQSDILERIPVEMFSDETDELSIKVAKIISDRIQDNNSGGEKTVLGLATGNTPLNVYRELIRLHTEEGLDFSRVITFNLDEYYGLNNNHVNSYHRFMWENLFEHVNIDAKNVHIPDGVISRDNLEDYCRNYERAIMDADGIDIQLLGIGRDGHIGFNEPGSKMNTRTRLVTLDEITRTDALPDFGERRHVPREAVTMGIGTILDAKQIILIATGDHKAEIIRRTVEDRVDETVAASYLQSHPNTTIFLDNAAASRLTRVRTPWIFEGVNWSDETMRTKAVCNLSEQLRIPFSRLTQQDFLNNSLAGLTEYCPTDELISHVSFAIKNKVVGDGELPGEKRILVFSPHPDDDIISMGGTLRKLVENGNDVRVAYMTPGYTAVFDHAVRNFITSMTRYYESSGRNSLDFQEITDFLERKKKSEYGLPDIPEVLRIKRIIRETEAISVCEFLGVNGYSFLNLPFYQTGRARKLPVGVEDIEIVKKTIVQYQPDIIFAAGDLTDPNGTHRLCLKAIHRALDQYDKSELWMYRGAWQEFQPAEADVLVPLTKADVELKREGIFRHESQKDKPPQPGHGKGEFWQRAELRNSDTAAKLALYGIGDYVAMEAFKIVRAG